jgi:zinc protease
MSCVPARRARARRRGRWGLGLAVLVVVLLVAAPDAAVRPPKMAYELLKLPNGLTVVLLEDHSTPIVHAQVWYHVGSKDERPGRTGFAHLFEHMMFKGSKNVQPEQHASAISAVGGISNAYTTEDVTVFWETVPAQYLPLVLWLEADRMASLRIDKDTFKREREVVKEERRMRIENQPYGRLSEIIYDQVFTAHPYKHTTIGSMKDLEAASVEEVKAFYRAYYVPTNATLALVGDFDARQAAALVAEYLGRVPRLDGSIPRDIPKEPEQRQERRVTVRERWPLPVVVVAYHVAADGDPDSYPLHLAGKILSDGQSSRVYKRLVYDEGSALSAFGGANIFEDPSLFFAVAVVQPGHDPAAVEKALLAEMDRLRNEPATPRELERARNQFARDYVIGRESNQEKATQLAHAVVIHQDAASADSELDVFLRTTAEDVQRVARKYFTPQNRTIITVLPTAEDAR